MVDDRNRPIVGQTALEPDSPGGVSRISGEGVVYGPDGVPVSRVNAVVRGIPPGDGPHDLPGFSSARDPFTAAQAHQRIDEATYALEVRIPPLTPEEYQAIQQSIAGGHGGIVIRDNWFHSAVEGISMVYVTDDAPAADDPLPPLDGLDEQLTCCGQTFTRFSGEESFMAHQRAGHAQRAVEGDSRTPMTPLRPIEEA